MTQNVELSIPYNSMALRRAADMLSGMADDAFRELPSAEATHLPVQVAKTTTPAETVDTGPTGVDFETGITTNDVPADAPTVFGADTAATDTRVDHKGVAFNADFCANASDPFYGSGKNSGQWKKKRGVDDVTYNNWYASQLGSDSAPVEEVVDTAAAFGGGTTHQAPDAPKDAGALLTWVSEQQTAGHLTVVDIQAAYTECGLAINDLFPPTDPAAVAQHVTNLYNSLSAKVGA